MNSLLDIKKGLLDSWALVMNLLTEAKAGWGRASGQTLNTGLKLNHLYTNGVLLNLTYIA